MWLQNYVVNITVDLEAAVLGVIDSDADAAKKHRYGNDIHERSFIRHHCQHNEPGKGDSKG